MSYSPKNEACPQVRIAQSRVGEVAVCQDCGVVHLSLQHVSLRLDVNDFMVLAQMLGRAHAEIALWEKMARTRNDHQDPHPADASATVMH